MTDSRAAQGGEAAHWHSRRHLCKEYIKQAGTNRDHIRELLGEYLEGVCSGLNSQFNVDLDYKSILEQDMAELDRFSAPNGRLLLAEVDDQMAGIACLQKIGAGIGEVTRMYVRPAFRRRGIARALLEHLIQEARQIGYATIRLDTARSSPAHSLYHAAGFREIERYSESEIPQELQSMAVYMEMTLR